MNLKEQILLFFKRNSDCDFTLSQTIDELQLEPKKYTSVVLYHLRRFVNSGQLRKTENKTYKFINDKKCDTINILYIGDARAGSNDSFIDEENGLTTIPVKASLINYDPKDLMLVSVKGDSMEPGLPDGSLLLFKKIPEGVIPNDDRIIFCRYNSGFKIKRFKHLSNNFAALISDNKRYTPLIIDENTDFAAKGEFISIIR